MLSLRSLSLVAVFLLSLSFRVYSYDLSEAFHRLSNIELPYLSESIIEAMEQYDQSSEDLSDITKAAYRIWISRLREVPRDRITSSAISLMDNLSADYFDKKVDLASNPPGGSLELTLEQQVLSRMISAWALAFSENRPSYGTTPKLIGWQLSCYSDDCQSEVRERYKADVDKDVSLAMAGFYECEEASHEDLGEHVLWLCDLLNQRMLLQDEPAMA